MTTADANIVEQAVQSIDFANINVQSHYLLVDCKMSVWGGTKSDREVARKTEEENASSRKGSYTKQLVRKSRKHHTTLSQLSGMKATTEAWFKAITSPWDDAGRRAISVRRLESFMAEFSERRDRFYRLLNEFIDSDYEQEIEHAKNELGSLFKIEDYPTKDSMRRKFHFSFSTEAIQGVEALSHFSTVLSNETTSRIAQVVGESMIDKLKGSYESELKRMFETFADFRIALDDAKHTIKERTWENLAEYLDRVPDINLVNSPVLNEAAAKIEEAMSETDPQDVRDNYTSAADLAVVLDDVLVGIDAELNSMFG